MDFSRAPHHDGSPLYLDNEAPAMGDRVNVRVRIDAADPVDRMWIRTTQDAEPTFHECEILRRDDRVVWWQGTLPMHNPVMHYRFVLARGASYTWLGGAGETAYDVPDAHDYRVASYAAAPDWGRDGVVYQIFPDRFARSTDADERATPDWAIPAEWDDTVVFEGSDPATPLQFFGGDLDGVIEHLDHVAEVGADVIYTTPVFPGESNHRYNASTFDEVDPLLGGNVAYERLSSAVHQRGWRILGDLTTNHTGDTHEWFRRASADPDSPERNFYYFNADGTYANWMGHDTLPKVNHGDPQLSAAFVSGPDSIVGRWLRPPFDVDGWRIDVANMTGRLGTIDINHQVARAVRKTATDQRADALVIGEHNHDASNDVDGDGWHGTMNYSGFSWPIWEWLRADHTAARSFGTPMPIPQRTGPEVVSTMRSWMGRLGFRALSASWNILGSHDSARIRTVVGGAERHRVAAGLQFTLPGVPMIFAGDELGLEGVLGEDSRRPMPWNDPDSWDNDTLAAYSMLSALRREVTALRRGGLRWLHVSDDLLAFTREHPEGSALVIAHRGTGGGAVTGAAGGAVRIPWPDSLPLSSRAATNSTTNGQIIQSERSNNPERVVTNVQFSPGELIAQTSDEPWLEILTYAEPG